MNCPKPITNLRLNTDNRNKAIKEYGYGPANPLDKNLNFWQKKADLWDISIQEAQKMRCGNCSAFDITSRIKKCISENLDSGEETTEAGQLGYCHALKFKCASLRTCDIWIVGGPINDKKKDWFIYIVISIIVLMLIYFIVKYNKK